MFKHRAPNHQDSGSALGSAELQPASSSDKTPRRRSQFLTSITSLFSRQRESSSREASGELTPSISLPSVSSQDVQIVANSTPVSLSNFPSEHSTHDGTTQINVEDQDLLSPSNVSATQIEPENKHPAPTLGLHNIQQMLSSKRNLISEGSFRQISSDFHIDIGSDREVPGPRKAPSELQNGNKLNSIGEGLKLALECLGSQDNRLVSRAGVAMAALLKDCGSSEIFEASAESKSSFHLLSKEELVALKTLSLSKSPALRSVASLALADFSIRELIPKGKCSNKEFVAKITKLIESEHISLQIFALSMAVEHVGQGQHQIENLLKSRWFAKTINVIKLCLQSSRQQTARSSVDHNGTEPTISLSADISDDGSVCKSESDSDGQTKESNLLQFSEEQKRLLKLAFEFISKLQLEKAEELLKRKSRENADLLLELSLERVELINLITAMCKGCSLHSYTSLLRLLFNALSGLVKSLGNHEEEELTSTFVSSTLNVVFDRTLEAHHQYSLLSLAMSQSIGDRDDDLVDFYDHDEFNRDVDSSVRASSSPQYMATGNSNPDSMFLRRNSSLSTASLNFSSPQFQGQRQHLSMGAGNLSFRQPSISSPYFAVNSSVGHGVSSGPYEVMANESKVAMAQRFAQQSTSQMAKRQYLVVVAMEALKVLQYACENSRVIANRTVEAFDYRDGMRVLNMLYRSNVPGSNAAVADFLHAVCENADDYFKLQFCETGVIVRLIRLASPSSVYGKKTDDLDEAAFVSSIKALKCLAVVEGVAARIIIAGGVGALYSHANSNLKTRTFAKDALDALGVSNISDLVETWTVHREKNLEFKNSRACSAGSITEFQISLEDETAKKGPKSTKSKKETKASIIKEVRQRIQSLHRKDGHSIMLKENDICADPYSGARWKETASNLGTGAFSTVYKAYLRKAEATYENPEHEWKDQSEDGRFIPVAVKKLKKSAIADKSFLEEIKILAMVPPHANIINLHGVVMQGDSVLIVSELGGPQTLADHLRSINSPDKRAVSLLCTSWVARLKVLLGIADALRALQSRTPFPIIHLDLKSNNILITDMGNGRFLPKLCDFGLAIELKPGLEFLSPANHGTLQWMAPEVMRNPEIEVSKGFDQSADTYSFAILMWEMAHPGRVPWDELQDYQDLQHKIREHVTSGHRPQCVKTELWPAGYFDLMRACWRDIPLRRPLFVRSFLTDPDYLSGGFGLKKRNPNEEIIRACLLRMLWDIKSASRVSAGANVSKPPKMQSLLNKQSSKRLVVKRERDGLPAHDLSPPILLNVAEPPARTQSPRLRRQSDVTIGSVNPLLGSNFDYHDFESDDFDLTHGPGALHQANVGSQREMPGRHASSSVDESSLATHLVQVWGGSFE